jgi:hypothetical protein
MSCPERAPARPRRPSFFVLALATVLLSCEAESPPGEPTRETLANGAVLVRYPGLPAIDSVGPEVTDAQVDLQFGSLEGDDPAFAFADIRGIQASSDGDIFVLDFQAAEVRVFDSMGRHLRTIVRRGTGPGEIGEANGIFLSGDTLLWIPDHSQGMIIGVDPFGEEIRRFRKPVSGYGYIWSGAFDDPGRYWKETFHSENEPRNLPPTGVGSVTGRRYYKSYDLSSGATDSVYLGEISRRFYAYTTAMGSGSLDIPFEAFEMIAVNPSGGFWGAHNASYRIARTSESGDTLVVIEAAVAVQRVTDEDRSAYIGDIAEDRPERRREAGEVAALMPVVKPMLQGLFVDDQGRLWVERVTPRDAPAFYDLYSQDGDYLGSVRLAFEAAGPIWVRHGDIYSWVVDELEAPYVVRASAP